MKLGEYLTKHGILPREFAILIKVSTASVYQYIKGVRPHEKTVARILAVTEGQVTHKDLGYEITYKAKRG